MIDEQEPIYSYSRKQAIADGVLVDCTEIAREAGFRYSVALTRRLWDSFIVPDDESRQHGQSEQGRLWDVLNVLRAAIGLSRGGSEIQFDVLFWTVDGGQRSQTLCSICGPDDDFAPCITIMLPDED